MSQTGKIDRGDQDCWHFAQRSFRAEVNIHRASASTFNPLFWLPTCHYHSTRLGGLRQSYCHCAFC